ncbi:Uncharacterized protein PECH_007066 [Penicillium ucsense]|uniref:RNA polymerase I-specific transcription initiation factor RRN6-like protein n=1 Tax=Penicillium ucsense TaxID=2839758 RepID=A0A8J8WGL6_9EURO|nr:Uncharacterized protein PECM_008158 [Penicillium ucsense]KAF7735181.1 Uncharacterized protein PECH_007066 [Penicillium ucsense]
MDEHSESALLYGHVGRATYLTETQSWVFSRSFDQRIPISYTGVTKTTIIPPKRDSQPLNRSKPIRTAGPQLLPHVLPELAPQWSSYRDDTFSRIVQDVSSICDPQIGTLLDLGYASYHGVDDTRGRYPVAIAAAVTGECGNTISFHVVTDEVGELPIEDAAHRVPSIGQAEITEWSKRGAPIQHICFAKPLEEKSTWMAARLQQGTTIFRPLYRRVPVPMYVSDDDTAFSAPLRNSRLDANPIIEIDQSQTGGFPHADVTFNPWYPRQFAVVDTRGNWSIWEISGRQRRRRATWAVACTKNGALPQMDDKPDSTKTRHDGWASIEWVADFSTILVSDRRCLMLYRLVDGQVESDLVELGMTRQSEWILDVQRSTQVVSHFFVLTTSRLLWYDIASFSSSAYGTRVPLRPRVTWLHYRDPEDTTLHLGDLMIGTDLHLILYSRLTELVQTFPCPFTADDLTEMIPLPDPFILDVPTTIQSSITEEDIPVHYSTLTFREIEHSSMIIGKPENGPTIKLAKLFWMDSARAVHESVFRLPDGHAEVEEEMFLETSKVLRLKKRHHITRKKYNDADEDFIVDDWDETVAPPLAAVHQKLAKDSEPDLQWTLDFTSIYDSAVARLAVGRSPENAHSVGSTFDHLIKRLSDPASQLEWKSSETMLELNQGRPVLEDIDDTAHRLSEFVSALFADHSKAQSRYRYMVLPGIFSSALHGVPVPQLEADILSSTDFLSTYDRLVEEWLASIPHEIPHYTRVMKERIVRGLALEVLLSHIIRVSNTAVTAVTKGLDEIVEPSANDQLDVKDLTSSQIFTPTLPSSQLPSSQITASAVASSQVSSDHISKQAQAHQYTALSAFTTFKTPRPMARNVANLLSHWEPGADPKNYDWQRISGRIDAEEVHRLGGPSLPRRSRSRRKSQQPAMSQGMSLPDTPVAPFIRTWGSQPADPLPTAPVASSQPTLDELPMTQMERGQFGAREVKKTPKPKKKRRAAGF